MPIIPDTWEAEAGASEAQGLYEQLSNTLSQIEEGLGVYHRGRRLLNSVPYTVKRRKKLVRRVAFSMPKPTTWTICDVELKGEGRSRRI